MTLNVVRRKRDSEEVRDAALAQFFALDERFGEVELVAVGCRVRPTSSKNRVVFSTFASRSASAMRPLALNCVAHSGRCSM